MIRWKKWLNKMRKTNHHVVACKQELEKMIGSGDELPRDDSKLVVEEANIEENEAKADIEEVEVKVDIEEIEAEADIEEAEIEVGVQTSMDIKIKVIVLEIQAQVEEPTRFEQDGKWLAQLGDVNSDSLEQQIVVDQTHSHEVNNEMLLKISVQVAYPSNENEIIESLKYNCKKSLGFDWYNFLGEHQVFMKF